MSYLIVPDYLPANRAEVTKSWLIDTLSSHLTFVHDKILSASIKPMGDGLGQTRNRPSGISSCRSQSRKSFFWTAE